jgi:uncharacterized membrane protein YhaH (DUF805 family)
MSDVYAAPQADLTVDYPSVGTYPGLTRMPYFLWMMGVQLGGTAIMAVLAGAVDPALGVAVGYALLLGGFVYISVLRFRNQGASGWWALGLFVPILNFYVGIRALAYQEGYCEQGRLDRTGKLIVYLYVGSVLLAVAAAMFLPMFAAVVQP